MIIKMTKSCPHNVDTIVTFTKFDTAPKFTCPTLQKIYDEYYGNDDTSLKAGEIKYRRIKIGEEFRNLLIVGFDCHREDAFAFFRKTVLKLGSKLKEINSKAAFIDKLTELVFTDDKEEIVKQFAMTMPMSEYTFDKYILDKKDKQEKEIYIYGDYVEALEEANNIAEGIKISKDLVNEPANVLTPAELAERTVHLGTKYGFDVKVYSKEECEELGMSAFLAVASASVNEPKFIVMKYKGLDSDSYEGIIGKGLCYDSGGLFLKPGRSMVEEKSDMAGAASVIGAMCAMAANKVKKNIVAVVAACENMVDGKGYRNGDILSTMNGKSVFIGSTDAEGRLTMADALTYLVRKENVDSIVEFSTLTGSCANFFGDVCAAVLTTDDDMYEKMVSKSTLTGEKYWRMPVFDEYKEMIKSDIADLKNKSVSAAGICAGLFLDQFKEDKKFMHVDIAGVAFTNAKGGSGFGVKSIYYYFNR